MSTVQIVCPHCDFSKSVDGAKIPADAKSITCPKCQQRFPFARDDDFAFEKPGHAAREINKVALLVITFFLGGVGGHKFYLRKYLQGVLYLVFCWTAIPSLIAFVEFIIYIFTSEEDMQRKYA